MRPALVLVTDPAYDDEHIVFVTKQVVKEIGRDAFAVQLRDKRPRPIEELRRLAVQLAQHAAVVFNVDGPDTDSRLDIAREVGAAHLGGSVVSVAEARVSVGFDAWLSVPAHRVDDVRVAAQKGVDAVLFSPIFGSPKKGEPLGLDSIRWARSVAGPDLHLIALGGVDESNAASCAEAGAGGVAVIRALLKAQDVRAVARTLVTPFLQG